MNIQKSLVISYLFQSTTESLKYSFHIASFFHRDYPGVVFLINPDEKGLVIIMPNERRNTVLRVKSICFNTWKFPLLLWLDCFISPSSFLQSPKFFYCAWTSATK